MYISQSLSPGRSRRHSIFKHKRGNPLIASHTIPTAPLSSSHFTSTGSFQALQRIRRELLTLCQKQSSLLIQQLNNSHAKIQELEMRLLENQRRLAEKDMQLQQAQQQQRGAAVEKVLKEELDRRLRVVSDRFANLEELVVQKVYEVDANKIQARGSRQSMALAVSDVKAVDTEAMRALLDQKLQAVVLKNRQFRQDLKNMCSSFNDRLRQLQQSTAEIYMTVMAIHQKISDYQLNMALAQRKCSQTQKLILNSLSTLNTQFHSFTNTNLSRQKPQQPQQPQPQQRQSRHLPIAIAKPPQLVSPFEMQPNRSSNYDETVVYEKPKGGGGLDSYKGVIIGGGLDSYRELEERLRKAVRVKKIQTPIDVFLDDQYFIRKIDGAYLFDAEGDIFKTTIAEFRRLVAAGFLRGAEE